MSDSGESKPPSQTEQDQPTDTPAAAVASTPVDASTGSSPDGTPPVASSPGGGPPSGGNAEQSKPDDEATPEQSASQKDASVEPETSPSSESVGRSPSSNANTSSFHGPSSTAKYKRVKGQIIDINNARIGFLGAGKITEAIVRGLLEKAKLDPKRFFVASKSGRNLDFFKERECVVTKRAYEIFGKHDCDVIFLAFHGFVIRELFRAGGTRPLALTVNYIPNLRHPFYILSLVGGIPLTDIKQVLLNPEKPEKYKLEAHRIMLNTSVAYGIGLGALDCDKDVEKKCAPLVKSILSSITSSIEQFDEAQMDVACAVGGNGLAFCYYFLSSLSDGGFKMGLQKPMAVKFAAKTFLSAAQCLIESGKHPSELRDQVTSPSGPAIYGIHVLDKQDCASGMAAAVEGAFKRIKELSEMPR